MFQHVGQPPSQIKRLTCLDPAEVADPDARSTDRSSSYSGYSYRPLREKSSDAGTQFASSTRRRVPLLSEGAGLSGSVSTVCILTIDHALIRLLDAAAPGMAFDQVRCLDDLRTINPDHWYVLDPRAACLRCLDRLRHLRIRVPRDRILLLATPAPPHLLLKFGQVGNSGLVVSPYTALSLLRSSGARTDPRRAWADRERVLDPSTVSRAVRPLILLACGKARDRYTVAAAAAELGVTTRHLARLCKRSGAVPPNILLSLARVRSVVQDLRDPESSLDEIAERHGYADHSTLSRQFRRFVGERPGSYRRRWIAEQMGPRRQTHVRNRHRHTELADIT